MQSYARFFAPFLMGMLLLTGFMGLPSEEQVLKRYQQGITSPSQLIEAVNGLRQSQGLPALKVHPILMQTAQSQADYMASTGQITQNRPGGMTYTQQLLSLGFPLAGDLSLGGFRAENIMMQTDPLVWSGVPPVWQDADHMNTMLSQNFTHIGAGVSQSGAGYYYAVDCAAVTGSGQMQGSAGSILTSMPGGAEGAGGQPISQYMVPVARSTALPDGDVFHTVQYGQTLWTIAIEYGTTIKNIQSLNNLGEDLVIFQGQKLLVIKGATQPAPESPTNPPAEIPAGTKTPASSPTTIPALSTSTTIPTESGIADEEDPQSSSSSVSSKILVVVLIVAAFVGAGMAVWLIRDPRS
ncbi:MAG: LysM peptidoglycan-binding domain-containing protein [Chloroflexi bacterium]|nr:LysM peptidoglycan-binding domain-containing protein [Chloroflexota bacterium]